MDSNFFCKAVKTREHLNKIMVARAEDGTISDNPELINATLSAISPCCSAGTLIFLNQNMIVSAPTVSIVNLRLVH